MPQNGNSCIKDPVTGYLTPTQHGGTMVFGSESKVKFIQAFEETGDLTKSCAIIGVSYQTMRDHCRFDEAFARDLNITLSKMESTLTGVMYKRALDPNGTMDRFGWLRAHNPSKWNPKTTVSITSDDKPVDLLFDKASNAYCLPVDADVLPNDTSSASS